MLLLWVYFARLEHYVALQPKLWARAWIIRRILNVGLPAGGEFLMMFVILGVLYWVIRGFGPAAQAGFGIGGRVMQALFLPVMAIAFAVAPVAGQNYGARQFERVRETFRTAAVRELRADAAHHAACASGVRSGSSTRSRAQPDVVAVGGPYLRIISWNFVATGLIFTCSGIFQALGNTWPSLLSSGSRLLTFVLPALWLSKRPGFTLTEVWYLSVATVTLQALTSLALLRGSCGASWTLPASARPHCRWRCPHPPRAPSAIKRLFRLAPGCGSESGNDCVAVGSRGRRRRSHLAGSGRGRRRAPAADAERCMPVLVATAVMKRRAASSSLVTLPVRMSLAATSGFL